MTKIRAGKVWAASAALRRAKCARELNVTITMLAEKRMLAGVSFTKIRGANKPKRTG